MFSSKDIFLKSSGGGGYQISRSVRLRASATAYFNRTPASATNRTTWTWSGWVKRGSAGGPNVFTLFFAESGGNTNARIEYLASGQFRWFYQLAGVDIAYTLSNALYRDYSAWYHVVYVYDSTQATAANRQILYVNGVQTTNASVITPAQNTVTSINNTVTHWLGKNNSPEYFDGYMTEINFIDGQALTPSSFGETNAVTGVWQPKAYTGTYGTNGFYLNFSDNSNNTAATIGKDSSGNGNNWTPNNISVTSGVTYDSMVDSPTVGATSSNYCTLNPLRYGTGASSTSTVSEANLKFNSSGNAGTIIGTMAIPSTGKWYWEVVVPTQTYNYCMVGVISNQEALSSLAGGVGYLSTGYGVYSVNGQKYNNSSASAYMASTAQNTVITVAFDADTGSLYVGAGGSWANGTGSTNQTWDNAVAAFTSLTGTITPATSFDTGFFNINFGQRPFAYTPPTGFVALNTQNLPTPTISNGANYMAASLWTGNGTSQTIANTVNGIGMQPDLIWSKGRSGASNNSLVDSVRGITLQLSSNLTAADVTDATEITAITSTGFSVGNSSGAGYSTNANGTTYVGWQWKKGATQGFDIVTYTGNYNGTSGTQTIAHSLGVAPKMIIVKNRSSAFDWGVGHAEHWLEPSWKP